MAKAKEGEKQEEDALEIISMGKLYNGPWEKKYWSSSRGKDRHPYPVGYRAARMYNGIYYQMEILEGLRGPEFVIRSADGQSCSGQTPDIAWEGFQKKKSVRVKLSRVKRFSCKIDAVELFGFKTPSVRRLMRQLVVNANAAVGRNLPSACFNNGTSEKPHQQHTRCTVSHAEANSHHDLQVGLGKTKVTGKRSREHEDIHVNPISEATHEKGRYQTQTADGPQAMENCQGNPSEKDPSTSSLSNENNAYLETVGQEASNSIVPRILNPSKKLSTCSEAKILSTFADAKRFSFSNPEKKEGEIQVPKDSQMFNDADIFAPDTMDLNIDGTCNAEVEIPQESTRAASEGLKTSQILILEDSKTDSAQEIALDAENSERSDFDSVGQEIAKSMMTVLLPQAVPLLKTFSRKKNTSLKSIKNLIHERKFQEEKNGTNVSLDVEPQELADNSSPEKLERQHGELHVSAKDLAENFQVDKQNGNVHILSTDMDALASSLDDLIAADSFEDDQCETKKYTLVRHSHDAPEADQNNFGKDSCTDRGLVDRYCQKNQELCDTASSKPNFCEDATKVLVKGTQRVCNLESNVRLGITSSKDVSIPSEEISSLHQISPEQNHANISSCPAEGTGSKHAISKSAEGYVSAKGVNGLPEGTFTCSFSVGSFLNIANSTSRENTPHSEGVSHRDSRSHLAPQTCSASKHLPALDNSRENPCNRLVKRDPLDYLRRADKQPQNLQMDRSPEVNHGRSWGNPAVASHQEHVRSPKDTSSSDRLSPLTTYGGKYKASGCNKLFGVQRRYGISGAISSWQAPRVSHRDITPKEAKNESSLTTTNMIHDGQLVNIFELVGCYVYPTPISTVLLRTKGNEIYMCVLCGSLMEKGRTLFICKTSVNGEKRGCPSFIGHATMTLPFSRDAFGREASLNSSCLQLTPDGNFLVLLNNIKAPCCREGNINCPCSVCTSECFEKNAVKIVQVKLGYVQIISKLETSDDVCCILVCEPCYLVAAEESGILHLWTMNSTWSAKTEESYLPTSACMPDYIVELKKIPKFAALVVGHNALGDFCLWDISRRILVSTFSAPGTSYSQFFPINLFRWPSQVFTTDACRKEQVKHIMDETKNWSNKTGINYASFPVKEDVSLVLLIAPGLHLDLQNEYPLNDFIVNPVGCWNLALLAKNKLISKNPLDASAAIVGASAGYGIIGTCDGLLCIWELSTGTKLGYLSHCRGARVSCFAADDADSDAFAVAVDGNQLHVYSHPPRVSADCEL